jgi:hypothetical protein
MKNKSIFDKKIKRLISYKKLPQNWDGYEALKPDKRIVDSAILLLKICKKNRFFSPTPMIGGDQEVGLYFQKNEYYIEFSITNRYRYDLLIMKRKNLLWFEKNKKLNFFSQKLKKLLTKLN